MNKIRRPNLFKWKGLLIALAALSVFVYFRGHNLTSHLHTLLTKQARVFQGEYINCSVIRVVDGDNFHCRLPDGKDEQVRLTGVDTPEIDSNPKAIRDSERSGRYIETKISPGSEAANFTKSYLKSGVTVRLELDVQPRDKYGSMLAYVYLPNGKMFNALIIQEGYAQVKILFPNVKYQDLFLKLQREAKEQGKGLWGK